MPPTDTLVKDLIDKRASAWEQMKGLLDEAEKRDDKSLSAEEQASFDKMNGELDTFDKRIGELGELEERNRKADEARSRYEKIAHPKGDPAPDPAEEAVRSFLRGEARSIDLDFAEIAKAHRVHSDGSREFRLMQEDVAASGGAVVPTSFLRQLYEILVDNSAIRQTNVTVLTTQGGESLVIPKVKSHGTAVQVGEGTAITGTDPSLDSVTLAAWKYGEIVQVSTELIQDSGVDILSFIAQTAGRAVGEKSGTDFITGNGTNKPMGIMTACGTGVTGATGGTGIPSADDLITLFHSVKAAYRRNGWWMMNDTTLGTIRKFKDSTNQYLWVPGLTVGAADTILGRPIVTDPNVAATGTAVKSIAFGDFRGYYIRDVRGIRFERSDEFAFDKDLVTFRAVLRTDGDLVDLTGCVNAFRGGTA